MGRRRLQQGEPGGIDVEPTVQVWVAGGCAGPLGPSFFNSFLPLFDCGGFPVELVLVGAGVHSSTILGVIFLYCSLVIR